MLPACFPGAPSPSPYSSPPRGEGTCCTCGGWGAEPGGRRTVVWRRELRGERFMPARSGSRQIVVLQLPKRQTAGTVRRSPGGADAPCSGRLGRVHFRTSPRAVGPERSKRAAPSRGIKGRRPPRIVMLKACLWHHRAPTWRRFGEAGRFVSRSSEFAGINREDQSFGTPPRAAAMRGSAWRTRAPVPSLRPRCPSRWSRGRR